MRSRTSARSIRNRRTAAAVAPAPAPVPTPRRRTTLPRAAHCGASVPRRRMDARPRQHEVPAGDRPASKDASVNERVPEFRYGNAGTRHALGSPSVRFRPGQRQLAGMAYDRNGSRLCENSWVAKNVISDGPREFDLTRLSGLERTQTELWRTPADRSREFSHSLGREGTFRAVNATGMRYGRSPAKSGSSRVPWNRLKAAVRGSLDRQPLRQAGEHLSTG